MKKNFPAKNPDSSVIKIERHSNMRPEAEKVIRTLNIAEASKSDIALGHCRSRKKVIWIKIEKHFLISLRFIFREEEDYKIEKEFSLISSKSLSNYQRPSDLAEEWIISAS